MACQANVAGGAGNSRAWNVANPQPECICIVSFEDHRREPDGRNADFSDHIQMRRRFRHWKSCAAGVDCARDGGPIWGARILREKPNGNWLEARWSAQAIGISKEMSL
jgi:hypothetical protein